MRGRFGSNNNPNCLQFTSAIKSILLHTSITPSNGNCNLFTHKDSLFSIKWKYKRPYMEQENEEESTIKLLADNKCNDPFFKNYYLICDGTILSVAVIVTSWGQLSEK